MKELAIASLAALGAIVAAVIGMLQCNDPFDWRKFMASALTGVLSGVAYATSYHFLADSMTFLDGAAAFLGGAGVDALRSRITGAIQRPPGGSMP